MATRRTFFYGLYMDSALLESLGLHPVPVGAARLDGYQLLIGERATVRPADGHTVYGLLHDLPEQELATLYARPEVRGYVDITVNATLLTDASTHEASCYVLEPVPDKIAFNADYAARLAKLVESLGLPAEYAARVRNSNCSEPPA